MTRKHGISYQNHVNRYAWAMQFCQKKTVLDAGSHMGFGAHILSQVADRVMLSDNNKDFIKFSQKCFKYFCPTDFNLCDFEKDFPAATDGFDTIVAFEVIEHLEKPQVFLGNVWKNLRAGGQLVFSVPYMMEARDHKHLYNKTSIYNLVSQYLIVDKLFIQDKDLEGKPMYNNVSCIVGVAHK